MKVITISGASGSGKSTLARYLLSKTGGSLLLSLDRYYLSKTEQIEKNGFFNFDDPASLDASLLKEHLNALRKTGTAEVPIYDFTISNRSGYEMVSATDFVIIDGLFAGALLANESDFNIFVDVDLDLALMRRIKRDMAERGRTFESVIDQYTNFVRPSFFKHVYNIRQHSDYIVSNNRTDTELMNDAEEIIKLLDQ